MVDLLHDRAAQARGQLKMLAGVNTAETLHPEEFPWQSPVDDTGYPPAPFRSAGHIRYELTYIASLLTVAGTLVQVDRAPDLWAVSVRNIANTNILVYQAETASGYPIDLGPGGFAKFPARGETRSLWLLNNGATTAKLNVWALAGPKDWLDQFFIAPN